MQFPLVETLNGCGPRYNDLRNNCAKMEHPSGRRALWNLKALLGGSARKFQNS